MDLDPHAWARFLDINPASIHAASRTAAGTRQLGLIRQFAKVPQTLLPFLSVRSLIVSVPSFFKELPDVDAISFYGGLELPLRRHLHLDEMSLAADPHIDLDLGSHY